MKSHTKIFLFTHIGYVTIKDQSFIPTIKKVNWYSEEINRSKYLSLVPTNENKEKIKKYLE